MENNWITVIIKDGNRVVNWEFSPETTLGDVLMKWEKGYHPVQSVVAHGAEIPDTVWGCFLPAFTEDRKLLLSVRTKFPKKQKEEDDDVG